MLSREPKRFQYLVASLLCFAIALVGFSGNLRYYIHPRYELFTVVLSLIGGAICFIAAWSYKFEGESKVEYGNFLELVAGFGTWLLAKGTWLVLLVALVLSLVPPKPLLSEVANQKRTQNYWQSYERLEDIYWSDSPEQINEIVGLASNIKTAQNLIDYEIKLSGFVRPADNENFFKLSKFVLNCCAVDATPVEVLVYSPGWELEFKENDWVEVSGVIEATRELGSSDIFLNPRFVRSIDEPNDPYEYLRLD